MTNISDFIYLDYNCEYPTMVVGEVIDVFS